MPDDVKNMQDIGGVPPYLTKACPANFPELECNAPKAKGTRVGAVPLDLLDGVRWLRAPRPNRQWDSRRSLCSAQIVERERDHAAVGTRFQFAIPFLGVGRRRRADGHGGVQASRRAGRRTPGIL